MYFLNTSLDVYGISYNPFPTMFYPTPSIFVIFRTIYKTLETNCYFHVHSRMGIKHTPLLFRPRKYDGSKALKDDTLQRYEFFERSEILNHATPLALCFINLLISLCLFSMSSLIFSKLTLER